MDAAVKRYEYVDSKIGTAEYYLKTMELEESVKRFNPDIAIGVANKGTVALAYLSEMLHMKDAPTIRVEDGKILRDYGGDIKGKKILLVSDIDANNPELEPVKRLYEKKGAVVEIASPHFETLKNSDCLLRAEALSVHNRNFLAYQRAFCFLVEKKHF
jgi:hypothetical protein